MIDETNLESHGSWDVAEFTKDYTYVVPHDKPEWLDMMLDPCQLHVSERQESSGNPDLVLWK